MSDDTDTSSELSPCDCEALRAEWADNPNAVFPTDCDWYDCFSTIPEGDDVGEPSDSGPTGAECHCRVQPTLFSSLVTMPVNAKPIVNGFHWDIATFQLRTPQDGLDPIDPGYLRDVPFHLEQIGGTDAYFLIADEPWKPATRYWVSATPHPEYSDVGSSTAKLLDIAEPADHEAPRLGKPRFDGFRTFDSGGACPHRFGLFGFGEVSDNFETLFQPPVLVTLKGSGKTHRTWAILGITGQIPVDDAIRGFDCLQAPSIEDIGLHGDVEVTFEVYDFAGNVSEPVTLTVEFPPGPSGCSVDRRSQGQVYLAIVGLSLALLALRRRRRLR